NLQRQIIHDESRIGTPKSESAKAAVNRLVSPSFVDCVAHNLVLDSSNAMQVVALYDVVLDASDNVATRYLLNDACVLLGKPLVSGSALRMDGQLTVYNYNNGPCYRCIFPTPPPAETVTNCNDGGVLGVVTGIIGCYQALETIKIICGIGASYSQKLLLFDATTGVTRVVKLRGRSPICAICSGDSAPIKSLIDYVQFCGASATDKTITRRLLGPNERISALVGEYKNIKDRNIPHLLLDVRDKVQYDISRITGSVNIPWSVLPRRLGEVFDLIGAGSEGEDDGNGSNGDRDKNNEDAIKNKQKGVLPVYVLCRLGNNSQLATRLLQASGVTAVWDIEGGLYAWSDNVDPNFPKY
ncbi:Molybdenum cofactor synthesis protein 3, partial [Physocladia obscura]